MKEQENQDAEIIRQLRAELKGYLDSDNGQKQHADTRKKIQGFGAQLNSLNLIQICRELAEYFSKIKKAVDDGDAERKKQESGVDKFLDKLIDTVVGPSKTQNYSEADFIERLHEIEQRYVAARARASSPPPSSISREAYTEMNKKTAEHYAKGPHEKPEPKKPNAQEEAKLEQERQKQEQERLEQEKIRQEAERVAKEKLAKETRIGEISGEIQTLSKHIDLLGKAIKQKTDSIDRYKAVIEGQEKAREEKHKEKQALEETKQVLEEKIMENLKHFDQLDTRDQERLTAFFYARDKGDTNAEAKAIREAARGKGPLGRIVNKKREDEIRSNFELIGNRMDEIAEGKQAVARLEQNIKSIEREMQSDSQSDARKAVMQKISELEHALPVIEKEKSKSESHKAKLESDLDSLKQELGLGDQDAQQVQENQPKPQ